MQGPEGAGLGHAIGRGFVGAQGAGVGREVLIHLAQVEGRDHGQLGTIMFGVLDQVGPGLAGEDGGGQADVTTGAVLQVEFLATLMFGGDRIDGADRGLGHCHATAEAEA